MGRRITVPSAGDQTGQAHSDPSLPYYLLVPVHKGFVPFLTPGTPPLVDPMLRHLDWRGWRDINDLS